MEINIIPLALLAIACTLFGIAYSEAVLFSPIALLGCLAFILATLIGFWIYAFRECARQNISPNEELSNHYYTDSIKRLFKSVCSRLQNLTNSTRPDSNAGGIFVFRRKPRTEFLHLTNANGEMLHGFPWINEANTKDAVQSVTNTCGIKPEELKLVPNFSVDIEHAETDPQGNINKKMVKYWLAEVNPETKVAQNAGWLPYNEAIMLAASDPILEKVLTSCNSEIDGIQAMDVFEYESKSKACELGSAELQKWYKDSDNEGMLWKVTERRKKKISLGLSLMLPADQFETMTAEQPSINQQLGKSENSTSNQPASKYEQYQSGKSPLISSEQKQQPIKTGMLRSGNEQPSPSQPQSLFAEQSEMQFKTENTPQHSISSQSLSFISNQSQQPLKNGYRLGHKQSPSSHTSSFVSNQNQQPIKRENSFYGKPIYEGEDIDCSEAIMVTALISTASTILLMSVIGILNYFYPEQFDHFWNQIVTAFDWINQYFNSS